MKKYRMKKQEENKKIKEDLNNIKTKIIDKIAESYRNTTAKNYRKNF